MYSPIIFLCNLIIQLKSIIKYLQLKKTIFFQITMKFFTPLDDETKPPLPKILCNISTIAFPCYTPKSILLNPLIVNFVDINCLINFHHYPILKLSPVLKQTSFNIATPYIFPKPNPENNILSIPVITQSAIRLPKHSLLCYMQFISVADAVTFINHGKYPIHLTKKKTFFSC
jgi:hypothetical protein